MTKEDLYFFLKKNDIKMKWWKDELIAEISLELTERFFNLIKVNDIRPLYYEGHFLVDLVDVCSSLSIDPQYIFPRPEASEIAVSTVIKEKSNKKLVVFLYELDTDKPINLDFMSDGENELKSLIKYVKFGNQMEKQQHVKQLVEREILIRILANNW